MSPKKTAFCVIAAAFAITVLSKLRIHDWPPSLESATAIYVALIAAVILACRFINRIDFSRTWREIGLARSPLPAVAFVTIIYAPIGIWIAFTDAEPFPLGWRTIALVVVMVPLFEEILIRGFLFGQLQRRAGWPWIFSALVSGIFFGLAHLSIERAPTYQSFQEANLTGILGILWAWIYARWRFNLWFPITLHAAFNITGQRYPFFFSETGENWSLLVHGINFLVTSALAVALTLWLTPPIVDNRDPLDGASADADVDMASVTRVHAAESSEIDASSEENPESP